jgi:hypothetical protein
MYLLWYTTDHVFLWIWLTFKVDFYVIEFVNDLQ